MPMMYGHCKERDEWESKHRKLFLLFCGKLTFATSLYKLHGLKTIPYTATDLLERKPSISLQACLLGK